MEENAKFLAGHSDREKGAYLGAIASIATADREASQEELDYLAALCDAAELSDLQKNAVMRAANELSGKELIQCLDILKSSDLRFSLVTDLIAFAKSDNVYDEEEEESIHKISEYLGVNEHQFSLLDEFADKAKEKKLPVQEEEQGGFLTSLGLKDKLQNEGIGGSSLLKSLIGVAGPLIVGGMLARGLGRRTTGEGMPGSGGLGSLIGMLSGGRGLGTTSGMLGRVLGRGGHF